MFGRHGCSTSGKLIGNVTLEGSADSMTVGPARKIADAVSYPRAVLVIWRPRAAHSQLREPAGRTAQPCGCSSRRKEVGSGGIAYVDHRAHGEISGFYPGYDLARRCVPSPRGKKFVSSVRTEPIRDECFTPPGTPSQIPIAKIVPTDPRAQASKPVKGAFGALDLRSPVPRSEPCVQKSMSDVAHES